MQSIIVCDTCEPCGQKIRFLYNGRTYDLPAGMVNAIYKNGVYEDRMTDLKRRLNTLILGQDIFETENPDHHDAMREFCHKIGATPEQLRESLPDMIDAYDNVHDCNYSENVLWQAAIDKVIQNLKGEN